MWFLALHYHLFPRSFGQESRRPSWVDIDGRLGYFSSTHRECGTGWKKHYFFITLALSVLTNASGAWHSLKKMKYNSLSPIDLDHDEYNVAEHITNILALMTRMMTPTLSL